MVKKPDSAKPTSTRQKLLLAIEDHLKRNPGMKHTEFGWNAIRDSSLVERLRGGKDVTTAKLDAILKYLANPTH